MQPETRYHKGQKIGGRYLVHQALMDRGGYLTDPLPKTERMNQVATSATRAQ